MYFRALRGTTSEAAPESLSYESKHISNSHLVDVIASEHLSAWRLDRPTLEMCLGVVSVALGVVMAGSGDLASLRLLRELRWRIDEEITYGAHMALHVSIGLLFLGSGRASLSRSKAAIAALLIAFFPRFPRAAGDNQYHLQSLRHLWVLATDWRGLKAVDVETGVDVLVPLQIDLHTGLGYVGNGVADSLEPCQSLQVMAPCLLPPLCDIASVRVASERYYPSTLNFQHTSKIVHVKRRPGYLSYTHDPYALREGLREEQEYRHKKCHPGPACGKVSWAQPLQLLAKKSSKCTMRCIRMLF